AGEWTRRREIKTGIVGLAKAHIPSVLTAAGTAIAYADVYAAYALYGFIGPAVAFVLLAIVALLTLAAALLHGPALAGLGLIGAFVTPLIVATETPNYWALYLYLAVVTAAPPRRSPHGWLGGCRRSATWRRSPRKRSISLPASRSPLSSSFRVCCSDPMPGPARLPRCRRRRSPPISPPRCCSFSPPVTTRSRSRCSVSSLPRPSSSAGG